MAYYVYGEITLKHRDWVKDYLSQINAYIEKHQGKVLSRSINMEKVEGERPLPTNVILVEFPDRQSALNFFNDPDYQPLRQTRLDGAHNEMTMLPAEDVAVMSAAS